MKNLRKALTLLQILFTTAAFAQHGQTVRGTVVEKNTDKPIPYATVAILGTYPAIGTTTDSLGRFSLANVPLGRHDVEFGCLGYETAVLREIPVGSAKETVLDVRLGEELITVGAVVVRPAVNKTETVNTMALAGGRMLSVEESSRFAGSMDDPARLVSSFAGVTSNVGNNGIVVRGNAPRFFQWRMEGIEIPNPNHFADVTSFGGGGLTALSSQVLGNSDFFTGAFPAEYGNALSGVFDMHLRNGNNSRYEHTAQVGILGLEAASEGPFSRNYNGSYIFNYRYSTLALITPLLPADAGGTAYQDLSFKFFFPTKRAGNFSLWGVGLTDRSGTVAETDKSKWVYDQDMENQDVRQYMGAFGINHKLRIGESALLESALAATVNGLDMHTEKMNDDIVPVPENAIANTNWNFVFTSSLQKRFGEHHTNRTGIRLTGMMYDMLMRQAPQTGEQMATLTDESGFSTLVMAYTTSVIRFNAHWSLSLGLNAQWFTLNDHFTVEPRVSMRYRFASRHSLYLAYGMHSRLEMLNYYFSRVDGREVNRDLDFSKAHHISAGYDWSISDNLHLKVEPYVQYLYDIPIQAGTTFSFINLQGDEDLFIAREMVNGGKGLNYGVDITFEQFMTRGFYYMATASLFDSRYRTDTGEWYNTRYNRNFAVNLLAGKEWQLGKKRQNMLNVSGRLTLQGGDRYSPIDVAASEQQQEAVYDQSRPYSEQLSPAFIAHMTVSYRINRRKVAHEIALKVLNITGYKDYYGHRYNYVTHKVEAEREANIIPNISYKIEF